MAQPPTEPPNCDEPLLFRQFDTIPASMGKMSANQAILVVGNTKNVERELVLGQTRGGNATRENDPHHVYSSLRMPRAGRLTHGQGTKPDDAKPTNLRLRTPSLEPVQLTLWFHEFGSYAEDVVVDSAALASVREGNVYELQPVRKHGRTPAPKLVFAVGANTILAKGAPLSTATNAGASGGSKNKPAFQISLISAFQKLLGVPPRSAVQVRQVVDMAEVELDTVEIHVKDVNFGRDSQWSLASSMVGKCCYRDQRSLFMGSRIGQVRCLFRDGRSVLSGYVGTRTSVVFRSKSAKFVFLVQLSREMWHFEENGEIIFHKLVNTLFPMVFKKWRSNNAHHSVTILLFTSVDYTRAPWEALGGGERPSQCQGYYRVVVDQVSAYNWDKIMANLRLEFASFKRDVLLQKETPGRTGEIRGEPCPAVKGNLLEAINLSLSLVCDRFRNTDLRHSINHLVVVSPGTGLFDVDYDLMVETAKKMFSLDCALDLVCLGQPPLHTVPLFRYRNALGDVRHCVPKWCDMSFYAPAARDATRWVPRSKIYELQMMGVMANDANKFYLERLHFDLKCAVVEAMDNYDGAVFAPVRRKPVVCFSPPGGLQSAPGADRTPDAATLLLMRPAAPAAKTNVSTTNLSAQGTVTHVWTMGSALLTLYSLNKTEDGRRAFSIRSRMVSAPAAASAVPSSLRSQRSFESSASIARARPPNALLKRNSAISKDVLALRPPPKSKSERSDSQAETKKQHRDENNMCFQAVENPFRAQPSKLEHCSWWSDVFPHRIRQRLFKWHSLKAPAALPIATTLFPGSAELDTEYALHNYMLALSYENRLEIKTTRELMREMVRLRLAMGFQICCGDGVKRIEAERQSGGYPENIIKYFPSGECVGAIMYLSLNDEIHRIFYDYSGVLSVQLYHKIELKEERRVLLGSREGTNDTPLVRTRYATKYVPSRVNWRQTKPLAFNWNQFDQLLAGYEDSVTEMSCDFFHMKFVIVPAEPSVAAIPSPGEKLTDEEIRLEGLQKLVCLIEKGRYADPDAAPVKLKEDFLPDIHFYTGNLYNFLNEQAESFDISGTRPTNSLMVSDGLRFNTNIKLATLAQQLQSDGGLRLVDRTWHFKFHPHCFLGSEFVSWLVQNFEDISTREEALEYGQTLKERGLFEHVERRHGFLDGHYFYEFVAEYVDKSYEKRKSSGWFKKMTAPDREKDGRDKEGKDARDVKDVKERKERKDVKEGKEGRDGVRDTASSFASSLLSVQPQTPTLLKADSESLSTMERMPELKTAVSHLQRDSEASSLTDSQKLRRPKKFLTSRKVKYNCDPLGKSFRPELLDVHYDTVYNPEHCFHIRLQWLNTTTKFIDEAIIAWGRLCERYGLKLVETPWIELCTIPEVNPFHSFVSLRLALNPLTDAEFCSHPILQSNKFYFHLHLLKAADFLLDNRGTTFFSKENIEICYSWGKSTFKYAQFIHKTGAYIVELRDSGDFFMAPNNVHILRVNTLVRAFPDKGVKTSVFDSQKVMLDFRDKCKNETALRETFRNALRDLQENYDGRFDAHF